MYIGRVQELKALEEAFASDSNNVIILYGRYGLGKTELLLKFLKNKPGIYYLARESSEREQLLQMSAELTGSAGTISLADSLSFAIRQKKLPEQKTVVVLDEFQFLVKGELGFQEAIVKILNDYRGTEHIMFVLVSSSIRWVENSLVEDCPYIARLASRFIKLREFSFIEMVNRFPELPTEQAIYANAVLGGVPKYLNYWNKSRMEKDNIKLAGLSKNSPLINEPERFLKSELRELGAYNAILAAMASGAYKLNDIYNRTGFQRAKISVYIKNLIEIDIVEKIFSYDSAEHANVQKGLYRIKDKFIHFWYRYVFPNMSDIMMGEVEKVFAEKVAPTLGEYMRECFSDVCCEYLKLVGGEKGLKYDYSTWGVWYGKSGLIDIVAGDEKGHTLVAFCDFDDAMIKEEVIEESQKLLQTASLKPSEIYFFAKKSFSPEFILRADELGIKHVTLNDL